MQRFRLTCRECGRFLTDVYVESDFLGRDVVFSLNGFCAHVSDHELERDVDAVLSGYSRLPIRVEALDQAARSSS